MRFLLWILFWTRVAIAQFPPEREGVKIVKSAHHEGITISYKEVSICGVLSRPLQATPIRMLDPDSLSAWNM